MNSSDAEIFFSSFEETTSGTKWGKTKKAFIFSLKTHSKVLPPFKCLAKKKDKAIYKSSNYGPSFGRPSLFIGSKKRSMAKIGDPYSVPIEVHRNAPGVLVQVEKEVLAGTDKSFFPDNYEVFYLA